MILSKISMIGGKDSKNSKMNWKQHSIINLRMLQINSM